MRQNLRDIVTTVSSILLMCHWDHVVASKRNCGTFDPVEWMTNLPDALAEVPLKELAIPGSHDSGSYEMSTDFLPSAPEALRGLWHFPLFSLFFGGLVRGIAQTQSLTIGQQLETGIRYLDFRIGWREHHKDFYFVHTVYGPKIHQGLLEMKAFLDKHPKEVIILDLDQFHQFNKENHQKLIALLKSTFGSKFAQQIDMKKLTLKHLWDNKKQIIAIYNNKEAAGDKDFWTHRGVIESHWPNTPSPTIWVEKMTKSLEENKNAPGFLVCSAEVTPDVNYVISHRLEASIKTLTKKFNPVFNTWLAESPAKWKHQPNIVNKDYVELDDFVKNVLALNQHRNHK